MRRKGNDGKEGATTCSESFGLTKNKRKERHN
jgi:hypothetical protein